MSVYWLISAPAESGSKEETFKNLKRMTSEMADNYKMDVPALRVGTLDSLMTLSDDLERQDRYVEGAVHRFEKELLEKGPLHDPKHPLLPLVSVGRDDGNERNKNRKPPEEYLKNFEWDQARFPIKSTLPELVGIITKMVVGADEEVKGFLLEYNSIKSSLSTAERKGQGGLNAKSLVEFVEKRDVVATDKLNTVFCAVPKFAVQTFLSEYEGYASFTPAEGREPLNGVVPRSAKKVTEDQEYELHRVVVFRAAEDAFKVKAREARVTIRDFTFTEGQAAVDSEEMSSLRNQLRESVKKLVLRLSTSYDESFKAWMHLKAIRVFVESVLRYGLPPTFQAMLVKPGRSEEKVRKTLGILYKHLSTGYDKSEGDDGPQGTKFYPYVDIEVKVSCESDN
eukprot:CAMPEP_0181309992 /NCGR_PEP_ID=MMETSP1101-20121128/12328_1 /TAXON_ID=46948 /ORGANISM="Rhodomonas abbreviata, Strain Caron Lab Isolate" /LENGTH=395 /DNA_ID=CAMNT_0023416551 /DNA_START=138 /DNA_END=1325 /DNA_ORIENTATION=-